MPAKRSPPPESLSLSSKRVRTGSSLRTPVLLRTPDDPRSVAGSAISSRSVSEAEGRLPAEAECRLPAGPANPGVIRSRHQGPLSRLPVDSDILETFAKLRTDDNLSDEEAFLKFIATYDVPLSALSQISGNLLHCQLVFH